MRKPRSKKLAPHILSAIKTGPVPKLRDVHWLYDNEPDRLTTGELVIVFAEKFLFIPEGMKVGEPMVLDDFQKAFFLAVLDNPAKTRTAVLSMARRNSKTFCLAVLVLAYLVGPLTQRNATIASAASSRDQAALIFNLMEKIIHQSPEIEPHLRIIPSSKRIVSLATGSEYFAMSADAKTGYGKSLLLVILDESGQIRGETNDYVEMLISSQGSHENPLFVTISTQSPSDLDWLSITMDDAIRSQDPQTVVHLYTGPKDADMLDEAHWKASNPGLDVFRSRADLDKQLRTAARLPAQQAGAQNLLLNMRVAQTGLWLAPEPWRDCGEPIDLDLFRRGQVSVGLDLSARQDLTAAVLAVQGPAQVVHLLPYVYCPLEGIEERSLRDRTPYAAWVRDGHMVGLAGASMDYEQIMQHLRDALDDLDIEPATVEFDRWRIEVAKAAAERVGFAQGSTWNEVGQGYQSFSPRVECFERLMLNKQIAHGNHPLLTMAAANAIATMDPAGSKKLDKSKSTARIDPIVAAVMAAFAISEGAEDPVDSMYNDMNREMIM